MERNPRSLVRSIAYVGAVTGGYMLAGALVGAGIGSSIGDEENPYTIEGTQVVDHGTYEDYVNDTHKLEITIKDIEGRDQSLVVRFGEACVNATLPYAVAPELVDASDDSAVSDLLATQGAPCGTKPTDVRIAVSEVREVKEGLSDIENSEYNKRLANIAKVEKSITVLKAEEDDNSILIVTTLVGAIAAGGAALLSSATSEKDLRRRTAVWSKIGDSTFLPWSHSNGLTLLEKRYDNYRYSKKNGRK